MNHLVKHACLIIVALFCVTQCDGQESNRMILGNGESLSGDLVGIEDGELRFQSTLFGQTVVADLESISQVVFTRNMRGRKAEEPWEIELNNGDRVFGDLKSVNDRLVAVQSLRFGVMEIRRDSVVSLRQVKSRTDGILTIDSYRDWNISRKQRGLWDVDERGRLVANESGSYFAAKEDLPDAVSIDVRLSWSEKLDFMLGIGAPTSKSAVDTMSRIETWEDSLAFVDARENATMLYASIPQADKQLGLKINWYLPQRIVEVIGSDGSKLAKLKIPTLRSRVKPGVYLANREGDLVVESLTITELKTGDPPSMQDGQQPEKEALDRILVADGEMLSGNVWSFDGTTLVLQTDEEVRQVPAAELQSILMRKVRAPGKPNGNHCSIQFPDGCVVKGDLKRVADQVAVIKVDYCDEPVEIQLAEASRIASNILSKRKLPNATHLIRVGDERLRGQLILEEGSNEVQWGLPGCQPLPLSVADAIIFARKKPGAEGLAKAPTRLFLANRDVVDCQLDKIDDEFVYVRRDDAICKIPGSSVRAVELTTAPPESAWVTGGKAELDDGYVSLLQEDDYALHGHALKVGGKIGFDFSMTGGVFVEFYPFVSGLAKAYATPAFSMVLLDRQFYVYSGRPNFDAQPSMAFAKEGDNRIDFEVKNNSLRMTINGKKVGQLSLSKAPTKGSMICIRRERLPAEFAFGTGPNKQCKFKIAELSGGTGLKVIESERKTHVLTIPRFSRKLPPKNVICSRTGDLLRGKLIGFDGDKFRFQSKIDQFDFDRELVSALVWMDVSAVDPHAESEAVTVGQLDEPADTPNQVQVISRDGQRVSISIGSMTNDRLLGTSPYFGKMSFGIDEIKQIRFGKSANQARDVAWHDWIAVPSKEVQLEGDCPTGSDAADSTTQPTRDSVVDDFELEMLDGTKQKLSSLRGKVVVLDFWATWCGPCVRSMPKIHDAVESVESDDVIMIAVNLEEQREPVKKFIKAKGWEVNVALDLDGEISKQFNVTSIPQTIVIDAEGRITSTNVGATSDLGDRLVAAITEALPKAKEPVQ